jgi:hypothetical protein
VAGISMAREPRWVRDPRAFLLVGLAGRGQGRGAGGAGQAVTGSSPSRLGPQEQAVAGRQQDQVADQSTGDGDQPPAQAAIRALPSRTP